MNINLPEGLNLDQETKKSITEQLFYVSPDINGCEFTDNILKLELAQDIVLPQETVTRILDIVNKTAASFNRISLKIYFENEAECENSLDPLESLLAARDVIENFPGVFVYQGGFLKLMQDIDGVVLALARSYRAIEQDYPTTLPVSSMSRNGYLSSFTQHAILASSVSPHVACLEKVAELSKALRPITSDSLAVPAQMLAPTVCHHCFESLKNSLIEGPNRIFTAKAKCHRNEYKTLRSLERLQTFTMREIVFYGDQQFVEDRLGECVEHAREKMIEWGIKARIISAADPFFANDAMKKMVLQNFLGLKRELQVYLPYSGKWLAVASFNNHRDTLVKTYNIEKQGKQALASGCAAYGIERFALGLMSQKKHADLLFRS